MSTTRNRHAVTPTCLIDEVMEVLARGERGLFADLAQATWQPQATLAALTGSLPMSGEAADQRDAA